MLVYCRVSRAKAPSWDGKTIYTAGGEGSQRPGPMLLTAQNEERMGRSWILQTETWGSDGNFILPCIPSFIQWVAEV